jgi:hypothetical protein
VATLYVLLCEAGIHYTVEPSDIISEVFEDAADDTIAAAMDLQSDLGLVFRVGVSHDVDVCGAILQHDLITGDGVEVGLRQRLVEGDVIDLFDLMTGMGELLRQVAVIRQQQHPGSVTVEPADGEDPFGRGLADQVQHGLAALRVVGGCDIILGLVQQYIDEVAGDGHFFSADFDEIGGRNFGARLCHGLAVHSHLSLPDELGCIAAAADAAVGDVLVQRKLISAFTRGFGARRVEGFGRNRSRMGGAFRGARAGGRGLRSRWDGAFSDLAEWGFRRRGGIRTDRSFRWRGRIRAQRSFRWRDGIRAEGAFAGCMGGLVTAGLAALFEMLFDGSFPLLFSRFFLLAEGFFDGAVALFIIEFAEIIGFARAEAALGSAAGSVWGVGAAGTFRGLVRT